MPGYSQTRLLLFLAENGPATLRRAHWRSRAASKTWDGTLRWCLSHAWVQLDHGVLAIAPDGLEALDRRREWHAAIRDEFRPLGDPYWTAQEGAGEWELFPPNSAARLSADE